MPEKSWLSLAGWLAVIEAVLTIPITAFFIYLFINESPVMNLFDSVLSVLGFFLTLFLLLTLKRVLNARFNFHNVDILIVTILSLGFLVMFSGLIAQIDEKMKIFDKIAILFLIPLGILLIVFGIRLMRLPENLYGLIKPYCYTLILSGIFWGSLVLFPLALLSDIANSIILAMVFFRAADEEVPLSAVSRPAE